VFFPNFAVYNIKWRQKMMGKPVLIVDDEKNIRLTLSIAIENMGLEIDTAMNGEEALAKLSQKDFGLMLLDLKMPGMDGMEVLRRVADIRPDIRVIIITAHGTIESAVDAMKLGAVDFIQKPFSPEQIRELISKVISRETIDEQKAMDYDSYIELAKRCVQDRHISAAMEHINKAISINSSRPEAFNFLGALLEIKGNRSEAQKYYRAAISLDPTYEPAQKNLERTTSFEQKGNIILDASKDKEGEK
jgi:FixJ family two-component response regulator